MLRLPTSTVCKQMKKFGFCCSDRCQNSYSISDVAHQLSCHLSGMLSAEVKTCLPPTNLTNISKIHIMKVWPLTLICQCCFADWFTQQSGLNFWRYSPVYIKGYSKPTTTKFPASTPKSPHILQFISSSILLIQPSLHLSLNHWNHHHLVHIFLFDPSPISFPLSW